MLAHALESASKFTSPSGVIDTYFASLNEKDGWSHLTHLYEAVNALLQKNIPANIQANVAVNIPDGSVQTPDISAHTPVNIPFNPLASASSVLAASALLQQQSKHPAERYTRWIVQVLRQGAENPNTRFGRQLQEIYAFQLAHFLQEQREEEGEGAGIGTPAQIATQMLAALEMEIAILTKE